MQSPVRLASPVHNLGIILPKDTKSKGRAHISTRALSSNSANLLCNNFILRDYQSSQLALIKSRQDPRKNVVVTTLEPEGHYVRSKSKPLSLSDIPIAEFVIKKLKSERDLSLKSANPRPS